MGFAKINWAYFIAPQSISDKFNDRSFSRR
jgi:hypothetical protein